MKFKKKFYILQILIFLFLFLINNTILNSESSELKSYQYFLKLIINFDNKAKEVGYKFLLEYPESKYTDSVYFYLSFVEDDYFKSIINLKNVINNFPESVWWEDSFYRLLELYFLHNNSVSFKNWYNKYLKNSKTFRLRYKIEILNLKMLIKNKEIEKAEKKIDYFFANASNKKLLSYSLFLKAYILFLKRKLSRSEYYLKVLLSMFPFSEYIPQTYLYLFRISKGAFKVYYSKKIIKTKIYALLNEEEKREILLYSKRKVFVNPDIKKTIDKRFIRNYYYVSIAIFNKQLLKEDGIISEQYKELINILKKNNIKFLKKAIGDFIQIVSNNFHFYSDALKYIEKLKNLGVEGKIFTITYNF